MKLRPLAAVAALAAALTSAPASALTIELNDIGGVTGTAAEVGFRAAAAYWESVLTNDVTLRFDVGYSKLGPGVLGGTNSRTLGGLRIEDYKTLLQLSGNSTLDAQAVAGFAAIDASGAVKAITPGYIDPVNKLGIDNSVRVFDADGSFNNQHVGITSANLRALGIKPGGSAADARIQFSSEFAFDFTPSNGISAGHFDFIGVAIHEMGHALGFSSGVDDYDYLGCPNGPACSNPTIRGYAVNDDWWAYAIDLFRYSNQNDGVGPGGPQLDWSPGTKSYFSVDGGASDLAGFSEGDSHGDGWQGSHWKSNGTCSGFVGIMNPYLCPGSNAVISAMDLAMMDTIGWNLNFDVLSQPGYRYSTSNIPEPEALGLSLLALAAGAAAVRRRRLK